MYQGNGIYQHYKGKFYFVFGVAKNSETEEKGIVYRPMYLTDWHGFMFRPLNGTDGFDTPTDHGFERFKKIGQ